MGKAHYIVTEELMISLLIGKPVRFINKDYLTKTAILVSIIDGKNRIYSFRDNEHPFEGHYVVEGAHIMHLDYDWDSINANINMANQMHIRKECRDFYNKNLFKTI